ncbi:MAG: nitrate reductase subunit alpha [Actinomycetia bacterium]|nr:nitrate reductase subunit alpha [Actinomycetes bacterium]MCP4087282.1 nitrate reductase subunit alpha [Actinomycetes bacterium]
MTGQWIQETVGPAERKWEEFYRNRFQHDKRVRTTHGVNCTGSCSWEVFVKDGIVTWELQATDYPELEEGLPPYEPRGCQRGISYSWYLYSPIRVKYPYVRGVLIDMYRQAKREALGDPVNAWAAIQENPEWRRKYQEARGKGGFRRIGWDEALELAAASTIHTVKEHGPDRVAGFSPIPAMSQISYAAGSRFMSLIGGAVMSFYDWYCDLPPASPEIWGEQTDVHESADWYNARFVAVMGANLNMTRTPDTHFISEVRHAGAKLAVFSPDFSQVAKYADWWVPTNPGQDTAFWLAVNHVLLTEFYDQKKVDYFEGYARQYTDLPFLVQVEDGKAGKCMRAGSLDAYAEVENPDWKLLMWDEGADAPRMPNGSIGDRWAEEDKGHWNLELKDRVTGEDINPRLSFIDHHDDVAEIQLEFFGNDGMATRSVPVRTVQTTDGPVTVTTVFDLLNARFGVNRGLKGYDAASYDDDDVPYTPAWQEQYTGVHRDTVVKFAREWGRNGELTKGKNLIIIGAGANHWYHNNLLYRSGIVALMLTGSVGVNGGGLGHYVGQEKLVNAASWGSIAFGLDWGVAPRHQNTPSFHYVHSDQWRYERGYRDYDSLPEEHPQNHDHTIDHQARAVRQGWLPFFPQFNESPIEVVRAARKEGADTDEAITEHIKNRLTSGDLEFAIDDPDAPTSWPRTWFIWRGNAIGTSAKGHEFFMKHYLGTHSSAIATEPDDHGVAEVTVRPDAPIGKMDLVVDLNFRMDTSALYSDLVLPAATWYEKDDLNTTDMHSFINPMQAAVPPAWESKSDWQIFTTLAKKVSEMAGGHLPAGAEDVIMQPLVHDSPDEIAQAQMGDWRTGEVEAIPGKTMPRFKVVKRDYAHLYEQMTSLGLGVRNNGVAAHGLRMQVDDFYDELARKQPDRRSGTDGAPRRPSLERDREVCEAILALDPASNGEIAHRAFEAEEAKTGQSLTHLGAGQRDTRIDFADLISQPRRILTTPTWSGLVGKGRPYSPYTLNVEHLVPWRTLTGRQHFYLDHDQYIAWGEHLPVYKPRPDHVMLSETEESMAEGQDGRLFNYITPHGKWSIHSTYGDNERMMTLSRGGYPIWLNVKDAADLGIADNDWVEIYNDNGVFVQRCTTSSRIPRGTVFVYHATERTVGIPISPRRKVRAGMNNSLTRARLKPVLMSGGYGQFTYAFNYWGPTGVNRDTFVYVRRIDTPDY